MHRYPVEERYQNFDLKCVIVRHPHNHIWLQNLHNTIFTTAYLYHICLHYLPKTDPTLKI